MIWSNRPKTKSEYLSNGLNENSDLERLQFSNSKPNMKLKFLVLLSAETSFYWYLRRQTIDSNTYIGKCLSIFNYLIS